MPRVLILADCPKDAALLADALHRDGLDCTWQRVDTERDYLAHLDPAPHVVLANYTLAAFDAPCALALLHERGLDIPFLVVADAGWEEQAAVCLKQGAVDYLLKDRLHRLGAVVRRAIADQRLHNEVRRLKVALRQAKAPRSERKQAEEAMRASEARYRHLVEHLPGVVYTTAAAPPYHTTYVSPQVEAMLGFPPEAWTNDPTLWISRLHPEDRARALAYAERLYATGGPDTAEFRSIARDGRVVWLRDEARIVPAANGQPAYCQGVLLDITARKEAEAQVSRQVARFTALRLIDMAITASLDRTVTLNVILNQLASRLGVDAAAVLVLNPHLRVLEHAASRGFRGQTVTRLRLRLGEGHAGRAALERRRIIVADLFLNPPEPPSLATEEGAVYYIAQPLISKGEVKGVLALLQRQAMSPDDEWLDFLEALAAQAAIALDNASLFEGMQHANLELTLAYEATIEGWSRALDLRDKETEGHSQRVTALTVELARALGLTGEELVHVRRGALLHDIGKMGIPDGILLKPGPLTDEEWAVMRQHPTFALELLQPIRYLHPALEIPFCHHEKWDGGGYPRGLRGEHIPLAARIFAVVDVYDALSSDRPYRPAWPPDKVCQYLREQAGRHFDPNVVQVFLSLLETAVEGTELWSAARRGATGA